jgi:hypothetical protein
MQEIENFPGYFITEDGEVWSNRSGRLKQLKPTIHLLRGQPGYRYIKIYPERKTVKISRLVALTFIPNPENKRCVNHINGIKQDDRVENLEWVTDSENSKHACRLGLKKPFGSSNLIVKQYSLDGTFIAEFESLGEAARRTNLNLANISRCCRNTRKTLGGYKWRYA